MKSRISKKSNLPEQYEQQSNMYLMWLLFDHEPIRPDAEKLQKALEDKFGRVDVISSSKELSSFGVKKYMSHFKEGDLPVQVIMGNVQQFKQEDISPAERAQIREVENRDEFLKKCTHKILVADMMAALGYKDRTTLLMDWLEIAVDLMPECYAVWIPSGGKLVPAQLIMRGEVEKTDRFVCYGVNARFFSISESREMLVDTHGMCAVGLPDIQCHFHTMDPNNVVNYVYNIAFYVYQSGQKIKDGDTIDGLDGDMIDENIQWKCQYEDAMVQPMRPVIDICPGKYAAGERDK